VSHGGIIRGIMRFFFWPPPPWADRDGDRDRSKKRSCSARHTEPEGAGGRADGRADGRIARHPPSLALAARRSCEMEGGPQAREGAGGQQQAAAWTGRNGKKQKMHF